MGLENIDNLIATPDGDQSWGADMRGAMETIKAGVSQDLTSTLPTTTTLPNVFPVGRSHAFVYPEQGWPTWGVLDVLRIGDRTLQKYYPYTSAFWQWRIGNLNNNTWDTGWVGDAAWQDATLRSGLSNYGSGYAPAGYYKDAAGFVHLRSLINYDGTAGGTVFTLPAGYRPAYRSIFSQPTGSSNAASVARLDVDINGNVLTWAPVSWLSLEGVTFRAEA